MIPVRSHHLKAMSRSALHCRVSLLGDEKNATAAMERGTAVDALVFGTRRVVRYPDGMKKPTAAMRNAKKPTPSSIASVQAYDAFMADADGAIVCTQAEYETASRMAEAVRQDRVARPWLEGIYQQTILWDFMGRAAQCTPDVVATDGSWIADLKTARSADPRQFPWQAKRLGYHNTAAYYRLAVAQKYDTLPDMVHVVVEAEFPYPVTVFRHTTQALALGERFCYAQMERLLVCEKSNEWPSYSQTICDLDVTDDDFALDFGDEAGGETDSEESEQE